MTKHAVFHILRAGAAILFVASAAGCNDGPPPPDPTMCHSPGNTLPGASDPPPRPANAAELALLAPVAPGQKLSDFDVREVRGDRGLIDVVCEKGAARVVLSVALFAKDGPTPPASTSRYAVFYSVRGATPEEAERLASALAAVLDKSTAPVPAGLGPFVPRPLSL
jgi:hypothetical protein